MNQIPKYNIINKNNKKKQTNLTKNFFKIKNIQQKLKTNFNQPNKSQIFNLTPSLLPQRALHTKTLKSYKKFKNKNNSI